MLANVDRLSRGSNSKLRGKQEADDEEGKTGSIEEGGPSRRPRRQPIMPNGQDVAYFRNSGGID